MSGTREIPQDSGEDEAVSAAEAARDLIENFRSGCCPFCGHDPYHYVDNGVGMERVAVTCCDLGIALYQDGDEQLSRVEGERHQAAHVIERLLFAREEIGWQDISTAPKDGTRVLVWFSYIPEEQARAQEVGRAEAARWNSFCDAWMLDHDAFDEGRRPTHWQPLPPPPVGSGRSLADANSKSPIQAREE